MIERDQKIYTVTEITGEVRGLLESAFPLIWVEGEISNFRVPSSGHMYFVLKDESSQLRTVMFKGNNLMLRFKPKDGQKILVRGRLTVYTPRGEYQLIADLMEPRGIGELQLAFQQLKERLAAEGLFDEKRKKPIPKFPGTVGIITSPTGAAVQDMIRILFRRFPSIHILFYPVKVQGEGSANEIAHAISEMNRDGRADVIIVGRGGGSIEDLWSFNEEIVARSIFSSSIPVVSAVGHEIDFTIADFVADLRAPTPSAGAELVVPDRIDLRNTIHHLLSRITAAAQRNVKTLWYEVELLFREKGLALPQQSILDYRQTIDDLYLSSCTEVKRNIGDNYKKFGYTARNLLIVSPKNTVPQKSLVLHSCIHKSGMAMSHLLETTAARLQSLSSNLNSLSPLNILDRGYGIVRKLPQKILVTSINQLEKEDIVEISLRDGLANCQVLDTIQDGHKK